jgi:hypothetical protein
MATAPQYAATPHVWQIRISTANTNRDGTGTLGTLATGAANGSVITAVQAQALATTTAGMIRFFVDSDELSTVEALFEIAVAAIIPAAGTAAWTSGVYILNPPLTLAENDTLLVGTHNAETFSVRAFGGDL